MNVLYHLSKANIVVDSLSVFSMKSVMHIEEDKKELVRDVHHLTRLGVRFVDLAKVNIWVQNGSKSSLVTEVKEKQDSDPVFVKLKETFQDHRVEVFSQ